MRGLRRTAAGLLMAASLPVLSVGTAQAVEPPLPLPTISIPPVPRILPTALPTAIPTVPPNRPPVFPTIRPTPTLTPAPPRVTPGASKTIVQEVPGPTRVVVVPGPTRTVTIPGPARTVAVPGPTVTITVTPEPAATVFTPGQERVIEKRIRDAQRKAGLVAVAAILAVSTLAIMIIYVSGFKKGSATSAKAIRSDLL